MEALVEGGGERVRAARPGCLCLVETVINVPAHGVCLPIQAEDVEVLCEAGAGERGVGARVGVASAGPTIVQRAMNFVRLVPEDVHDFTPAAVWPAAVLLVCRHHPNRRPDALAFRKFCADVEATILA